MREHTNRNTLRTMNRSEYTANVLLSMPRTAAPSWTKPAPVRATRTVKRSLVARIVARLFNV